MSKILINENGKALMSADGRVYKSTSDELKIARSILDKTITSYSDSEITSIGPHAFEQCYNLTSVELPNATRIASYAFCYCTVLASIDLPNVTSIGGYAFDTCIALISVNIPKMTSTESSEFQNCTALTSVKMPKVKRLGYSTFYNCSGLTDVYLGANQVVTLANTDVFTNAGTTQGYINVHVRAEYADQYATATNWSSLIADGTIVIVGDYND